MTAVPFSVAPAVHKSGIGLYFLGVVFLQTMLGVRQLSMKGLPRVLPALSFSIVASYLIFFILLILYESGIVGRTTPVFWEWMCFFTSMLWLLGHGIVLGKEDAGDQG
jgi:polyferredoxin